FGSQNVECPLSQVRRTLNELQLFVGLHVAGLVHKEGRVDDLRPRKRMLNRRDQAVRGAALGVTRVSRQADDADAGISNAKLSETVEVGRRVRPTRRNRPDVTDPILHGTQIVRVLIWTDNRGDFARFRKNDADGGAVAANTRKVACAGLEGVELVRV